MCLSLFLCNITFYLGKWAKERLHSLLATPQTKFEGSFTVDKCEGEASLLFLHGKKRAGYEFEEFKAKFTCTRGGCQMKGTVTCPCISSDELDWQVDFLCFYSLILILDTCCVRKNIDKLEQRR